MDFYIVSICNVATYAKSTRLRLYSAFDGNEGIALARQVKPDVILLDVEMPAPDGFEVCRRLKADSNLSSIPVIFLTAVTSTNEKVKGLSLGAVDYVIKPFEAPELLARFRACLRTKELLDLLEKRAMIDGLTGTWNRAYLDQRLPSELSLAKRTHHPLACIMADVEHFKSVNDKNGHGFGDFVLRGIAQLFLETARGEDVVCRYGGEEFAILAPSINVAGAVVFAERLRQVVASRIFSRDGVSLNVTCSFGVADTSGGVEGLLEQADRALYQAKQAGRNRVERTQAVQEATKYTPDKFV